MAATISLGLGQHLQLVGHQIAPAGPARIYELEVYAGGAAATPPAPAVPYADLNVSGRSQRFEAGQYEADRGNLRQLGNDAARSIEVAPRYLATICRDPAMAGGCTTLAAGRYDALPPGSDRTLTSLRVRPVP